MTRRHEFLPLAAQIAAAALVRRAENEEWDAERRLRAVADDRRDLDTAAGHERDVQPREQEELRRAAELEVGAKGADVLGIRRRLQEQLAALDAAYERARGERAAQRAALDEEERRLKEHAEEARLRARALREAKLSAAGLAPWDAAAQAALRAWGEPVPPPESEGAPLLRGSEAAALVQGRLGVSRSTYYEWYRPLLRSYDVFPSEVGWLPDGGAVLNRGATRRFRREEVEALLRFLVAEAS